MYISRVRVENIRGFSGTRNVDLSLTRPDGSHAGWTVIAGRNGSGKTSLLRAIALSIAGSFIAQSLMPDSRNWIATSESEGVVKVQLISHPGIDAVPSTAPVKNLNRQYVIWRTDAQGAVNVNPALPWTADARGWFCAAYGPFRRLVGGAADAQRLMQSPGPASRMVTLFHEDASLAEGVQWLINEHLRALEGRPGAQELKDAAIRILSNGLLPDGYEVSGVDSDGLWVISGDRRFPLREMSDGYRTVAALIVDLLKQLTEASGGDAPEIKEIDGIPTVQLPGVVLIDEVDAHLHVSWQKRIGGWLKAHFPNIQFIVTSHSPYVCQAADPGGLIRLPGPREEEPPQVVDEDLYERVVFGSGDDAVLSELFGLDSPYSEQAEDLRRELVSLEMKVVEGEASDDQVDRYKSLRRQLNSSSMARVDEVAARLQAQGELSGMIRISRVPLTDELDHWLSDLTRDLETADIEQRPVLAHKAWRRTNIRRHVHEPLQDLLRQMAPGLEQCMYCGRQGTDIDHFEPIKRNPLRTFDWLNHLLACSTCNSHRKRDQFPVDNAGRPLLIDPTTEDPFDHLFLGLDSGEYLPRKNSAKGQPTIEVCGLNHAPLPDSRRQSFRVVQLGLGQWDRARQNNDIAAMEHAILTVQEQPFADVCQAMLRQAESPGAEIIFEETPKLLNLLLQPDLRHALLS